MINTLISAIVAYCLKYLLAFLLSLVLTVVNALGNFMLKPFNFSTEMFSAVLSSDFLNILEDIMITGGIALSILFLVFGLIRVFTGRLTDDVPNPYSLVGKFVVAIFACYWIIPFMTMYLFPFAQTFFDKILNIDLNLLSVSSQTLIDNLMSSCDSTGDAVWSGISVFSSLMITVAFPQAAAIFQIIFFLICVIAALVNVFKLVIENAERYFTLNVLILSGPLAVACLVSEKASQIFKSWISAIAASILTIIFNLIGFKFIMLAFANCFAAWAGALDFGRSLIALISLVAVSKMAQKFDQLISMIVFKINPIQNRSMLMSALATVGALDKSSKGLTGATMRQNMGLDGGRKGGIFEFGGKNLFGKGGNAAAAAAGNESGKNFCAPNQSTAAFGAPGSLKDDNVSKLLDSQAKGSGNNDALEQYKKNSKNGGAYKLSEDGMRVDAGNAIDAFRAQNEAMGLGPDITESQASAMIDDINSGLQDGYAITGYDSNTNDFTIGKTSHMASSNASIHADGIAGKINGDSAYNYTGTKVFNSRQDALKSINDHCKSNNVKCTMYDIPKTGKDQYEIQNVTFSQNASAQHIISNR